MIEKLNDEFALGDRLRFFAGRGGLTTVRFSTGGSSGEVTLHGAQVTAWAPEGEQPVLWLSESSHFHPEKSIRGGIPICWPWFGDHETDPAQPVHGFARTSRFEVERTYELEDHGCGLELGLSHSPASHSNWPGEFKLSLVVEMGATLDVRLTMKNQSNVATTYGSALHTYLNVGDVEQVTLEGLAGTDFLDKVAAFARKHESGIPKIRGEMDRVFLDTERDCVLDDPVLGRRLRVTKQGSRTTVVWNPGPEKAEAMQDFDDQGFRKMLCVESPNAFDDRVTLEPGQQHTIGTRIGVEHQPPS